MIKLLTLGILISCAVVSVSAQSEADLKSYFEGKQVTLKIDMPATKDGVNVYPEREQLMDYGEYATRIKRSGTSIRRGDSIMITKIKVKDKHIEFQLGGGATEPRETKLIPLFMHRSLRRADMRRTWKKISRRKLTPNAVRS